MTTTTRKQLIQEKYTALRTAISAIAPDVEILFPCLEDISLVDMCFFLNMSFTDGSEESVRRDVETLATSYYPIDLSREQLDQLVPVISKFIIWFKNMQ